MKPVIFKTNPLENRRTVYNHKDWFRKQFKYFVEDCKLLREKKLEDFILNNGYTKLHVIRDNTVLEDFLDANSQITQVPIEQAELLVITDQRFSRITAKNIINGLNNYLTQVPAIYLCLNKLYLNYNDEFAVDYVLPEDEDAAVTQWLRTELSDARVFNLSTKFQETGANFTFVLPPCEHLICRS